MDTKKFLMGTVVGGIAFFFLGYLIYGMALTDFMAAHVGSATGVQRPMEEMVWWSLLLGNFLGGAFLTYVFLKWANVSSFGGGLSTGATLGFFLAATFDFTMFATSNVVDLTGVITDVIAYSVMSGISGGVIGMVLGMGKKA